MTSSIRSSRSSLAAVGRGLVVLGLVFLVYLLGLVALFRFTSDPVAAGQTYPWNSGDAVFVQPADGELQCVVHTPATAGRVTVRRPDTSLIPGELVDRPDASSVSLTCDQPARIAAGAAAQLFPATGPARSVYLFGGLVVIGAGLWLVGRLTGAGRRRSAAQHRSSRDGAAGEGERAGDERRER